MGYGHGPNCTYATNRQAFSEEAKPLAEFFTLNRPIIYFGYGLSFILMGWTILTLPRPASSLRLSHSLPYLAVFGLLHGLGEWGHLFVPIQEQYLAPSSIHWLHVVHQLLFSTSFLALFVFGCSLIGDGNPRFSWLPFLPVLIFAFWVVRFLVLEAFAAPPEDHLWAGYAEAWSRYLLALPGGLITAAGLFRQVRPFQQAGFHRLVPDLRATAMAMMAYALFAGLLVPQNSFFPASVLNRELLRSWGLPVPIPRAICAILIAYYMIRTLRVFKAEIQQRLNRAEADRGAVLERERLGRELHDGVLQSIYAAGLGLQAIRRRVRTEPDEAVRRIDLTLERLGNVIDEIRFHIVQLDTATEPAPDLAATVDQLAGDFEQTYGVPVTWQVETPATGTTPELSEQAVGIIREALANAGRHAEARSISIQVGPVREGLSVVVADDGQGFHLSEALTKEGHYGLRILHRRAEIAGGRLQIDSSPGRGTRIQAVLPILKEE